ncbi:hypothetical protein Ddye_017165 [Dipteronia dyeriana]|uniref:Uncharacterized protein n=1 Tax=Dipteronia dyeriana TaxID=168575 RepID=A0AAD9U839_9ROSI|nr:hypothetical protein Ddye_017165 [Dipteronia dyeriana]
MSYKNKFVNSKLIAEKYIDQWRANPDWNFARMSAQLRVYSNTDASRWQFCHARKAARQMIEGGIKDQYSKLSEYGVEMKRINPESSVILKCDDNARFERLYICLVALKKGWKWDVCLL